MRLRFLVLSVTLHGGLLAGAGVWLGNTPAPAAPAARTLALRWIPEQPAVEPPPADTILTPRAEEIEEAPPLRADELPAPADDFRDLLPPPRPPAAAPQSSTQVPRAAAHCRVVPRRDPPPQPPVAAPRAPQPRIDAVPIDDANTPPVYPRIAVHRGQEGSVVLRLRVDAAGRVVAVTVAQSSGHPLLDAAATEAARTWRYRPARCGARAVPDIVEQEFVFRLNTSGARGLGIGRAGDELAPIQTQRTRPRRRVSTALRGR